MMQANKNYHLINVPLFLFFLTKNIGLYIGFYICEIYVCKALACI